MSLGSIMYRCFLSMDLMIIRGWRRWTVSL